MIQPYQTLKKIRPPCSLCLGGLTLLLALSCSKAERQSPPPEPEPVGRSYQECYDECVKINMPRAVAWELIEGDCERACRQEVNGIQKEL